MSSNEAPPAVDAVYFVILAVLLGLLCVTAARAWPRSWPAAPVPYTAWILAVGLALGLANEASEVNGPVSGGISQWTSMNDSLIFAVFLPVLVFGSALGIQVHKLKHATATVALLAIGGTLFNAALIAVVARYVLPYDWSWSEASLLGAILSATDPVAVVSLMQSVGASEKLATVIEGESLLNDGVAYVLYEVVQKWQAGEDLTAGGIIGFAFKASLGGCGMGLAFGLGAIAWLVVLIGEDAVAETWVVLLTSYSCFVVSDELLGVSGMLALVFCGLIMAAGGSTFIKPRSRPAVTAFWHWADWTANTLIFFLSGAIIAREIWRSDSLRAVDFGWAVALWALLLAIRAAMVLAFWPLLRRLGYGMAWRDGLVLAWAGLRGAVSLVLALSVRNDPALGSDTYRERAFFMVALQALLTVLVQGSAMQPLLRVLGFLDLGPAQRAVYRDAATAVEEYGKLVESAAKGGGKEGPWQRLLGSPDWGRVHVASALGIVGLVEARPAPGQAVPPTLEERTEDVRERVLGMMRGCCDEMLASQFLSPRTHSTLTDSIEAAMDRVGSQLAAWELLHAQMGSLQQLEGLSRRLPRCFIPTNWLRWLAESRGEREVAATTAFALAAHYAGRQLAALEGAAAGAPPGRQLERAATLDSWHPLFVADISTIDHQHRDALLADVLHRGAAKFESADGALLGAIAVVHTEVAAAEAAAQEHLKALQQRYPGAAKKVITLHMAIALLDRKLDLLAALQSAGMLEPREVGAAMDVALRRIQAVRFLHRV